MDATGGHGCKVKNLRNVRLFFHPGGEPPGRATSQIAASKHAIITEL
jgi:hypothetical protein